MAPSNKKINISFDCIHDRDYLIFSIGRLIFNVRNIYVSILKSNQSYQFINENRVIVKKNYNIVLINKLTF